MDKHEIVVGNIGTVYSGNDESQATAKWNSYVLASREPHGRASGETVTWLEDGEIRCESDGSLYLNPNQTTTTAKTYPVIYDMEPIGVNGALEATNVHYFCSVECRAEHSADGQDGDSNDYLPTTQCEHCGKELA